MATVVADQASPLKTTPLRISGMSLIRQPSIYLIIAQRVKVKGGATLCATLVDATQMHRMQQAYHGTEDATRQVDRKCETLPEGVVPELAAQRRHLRPCQEQCHAHDGHNHHKLNEEEHKGNLDDDFHANLPTGRRPR